MMKTFVSSFRMPRLLFLAVAAMASAAAATSSQGINFTSQYWTAFLNISYVDSGRQVWHTERSETGRFGSNGVKEATGIAVEIISSVQNPKLRKETLTFILLKKKVKCRNWRNYAKLALEAGVLQQCNGFVFRSLMACRHTASQDQVLRAYLLVTLIAQLGLGRAGVFASF